MASSEPNAVARLWPLVIRPAVIRLPPLPKPDTLPPPLLKKPDDGPLVVLKKPGLGAKSMGE